MEQIEKQFDDDGIECYLNLLENICDNSHSFLVYSVLPFHVLLKHVEEWKTMHGYLSHISAHKELSIDIVLANPNIEWDWNVISSNPNFTIDIIKKHLDLPWNWSNISQTSHITTEDVTNNISLPWDFERLSRNSHLPPDILILFPQKPWDWNRLSFGMPMEFILQHPEMSWSWHYVGCNAKLTTNHIVKNLNLPWNWNTIATRWSCIHVPIDVVAKHSTCGWKFQHDTFISQYTFDEIMRHRNLPWNWNHVFRLFMNEFTTNHKQQRMKWILLVTIFEHYQILHKTQMHQPVVYDNFEHIVMNDYLLMMLLKY